MTEERIQEVIKLFAEEAKMIYGTALRKVILYGSCVRGDFEQDNNIDIILSKLIYGGRTSLLIVFAVISCSLFIGMRIGVAASLCGGIIDMLLSRLINFVMAVPSTMFTITLVNFSRLFSAFW